MSMTFFVSGHEYQTCPACEGEDHDCDLCYGLGEIDDLSINMSNSRAYCALFTLMRFDKSKLDCYGGSINAKDVVRRLKANANRSTTWFDQHDERIYNRLLEVAERAATMDETIHYG